MVENNFPKIKIDEALEVYQEVNNESLSKKALAEKIEYKSTPATIQNYIQRSINGEKELPISILKQIADICNVSTDFLLGRTDHKMDVTATLEKLKHHNYEMSEHLNTLAYTLNGTSDEQP